MSAPPSVTCSALPVVSSGPTVFNALTNYLRALLDDHHEHDLQDPSGTTWEDLRSGTARHLRAIRYKYKPLVREALQKNAALPEHEQEKPRKVRAEVRNELRTLAQRKWEDESCGEIARRASDLANVTDLRTPFAIAIPNLIRWINVPGIDEQQIREHLAELRWGGQLERTPLVAELERLDREGYAKRLAEIIAAECPSGAARVELNYGPDSKNRDRTPDKRKDKRQILPRDDATRSAIRCVNAHRKKVLDGAARPMSLRDLLAEFAGDKGAKEVARLERALRPDRWGNLLTPDKPPDK